MSIIKRKAGSEDIVKSILEFDEVPTEGSPNLVESGAVAKAIGNLGQPLQWKGPATVAQLNAGITGIQEGWTYTLTDAGTLTDGSIAVETGDEVAWTGTAWFKVGGDSGKIAVFECTYSQDAQGYVYPTADELNAARVAGKLPVIVQISPVGGNTYFVATQMTWYMKVVKFRFVDAETGAMLKLEGPESNPVWSSSSAQGITKFGDKTDADIPSDGILAIGGGNSLTKLTLTTLQAFTVKANTGVPNFAMEIDNTGNSNDVTVTVVDSLGTALKASAAGGDTVGAGKYVQLTCVGNCWTLAEFTVPTP